MPDTDIHGNSDWNVSTLIGRMQNLEDAGEVSGAPRITPWGGGDTLSSDAIEKLLTKLNVSRPFLSEPKDVEGHSVGNKSTIDKPKPTPKETQSLDTVFGNAVDNALTELKASFRPQLSDADIDQLRFALFHPELVDSTSYQAALTQLQGMLPLHMELAGPNYTLPPDFKPNPSELDEMLVRNYNTNFEVQLARYSLKHNLTPEQENTLKLMHYAPELGVKDQPTLKTILNELETNAMQSTRSAMHIPQSVSEVWKPPQDANRSKIFGHTIQMDYQKNVEINVRKALQAADPPLNDVQQGQLRGLLADPTQNEGVSPHIVGMANDIRAKASSQTKEAYNLTWNPAGPALWEGSTPALNVAIYADQLKTAYNNLTKKVPDGPIKDSLLSLLQIISSALATLQSSIYQMETEKAMSMSKQQLGTKDAMDAQLKIRTEYMAKMEAQRAEMAAQQAKANKMHDVMKIVGPIVIAVSIAVAVVSLGSASPVTAIVTGLMLGVMLHDAIDPKHSVMAMLTQAIATDMADRFHLDKKTAMILSTIATVLIVVAFMLMGAGADYAMASKSATTAATATVDAAAEGTKVSAEIASETAESAAGAVEFSGADVNADAAEIDVGELDSATRARTEANADIELQTRPRADSNVEFDSATRARADAGADANELEIDVEGTEGADKANASEVVDKAGTWKAKISYATKYLKVGAATMKLGASIAEVKSKQMEETVKDIEGNMGILFAKLRASDDEYTNYVDNNQKFIEQLLKILGSLPKWNESVSKIQAKMWKDNKIDFPV